MLRSNDGYPERPFRTDLGLPCHFCYYGKYGIGDMSRAGNESEEIGDERADDGHLRRVFTQQAFGDSHEIIESAGGLHCRSRRYYCGNHQHYVDGGRCGLEPEYKHKDGDADATHDPETYASETRSDYDCIQDK